MNRLLKLSGSFVAVSLSDVMGTFQVAIQYHLEVGHIFSNKRNDNEEGTTCSCRNCTNPGERGKSERGHREEFNRSAWRHAVELGMGESTVRRILHKMACNNVSFRDNR